MDEELLTYVVDRLHDADRELETTRVRISDDPSDGDALRSLGRAQEAVSQVLEHLDFFGMVASSDTNRLHDADRELETTRVRIGDDPSESDARRSLGRAQEAVSQVLEHLDPIFKDEPDDFFGRAEDE